jgi:hypothetical protein
LYTLFKILKADKRTMSSPNIKTAMARTICICVSAEISSIVPGGKKIVSVDSEGKLLTFRHK